MFATAEIYNYARSFQSCYNDVAFSIVTSWTLVSVYESIDIIEKNPRNSLPINVDVNEMTVHGNCPIRIKWI